MPKLLVVDDEPAMLLAILRRAFRGSPPEILTATTGREGLALAQEHHPDVTILDIILPDQSGLEVFRQLREIDARSPVIFITGSSTTETAIEAMKLGAYDYLLKPPRLVQLQQTIERALEIRRLMSTPTVLAETEPMNDRADAIVGRCPAMQEVYKAIGRVAPQDVTVLITGESGTGKELVARAIYQHSRRADKPFLAINCAAIPETLLESELFGHEKGAFTGAVRQRIGKFEQCSGGTLFLDEVGDMAPLTQSKLLRVLQEQRFERLGGNETIQTDVRLLAATNQNLEALISQGRFRADLYYRLSVFTIRLPPLRERGEDLPLLVEHYLRRYNRELGKDVQRVAPEALALLQRYPWPGNLRELQSVLKQALLQTTGSVLVADFLPEYLRQKCGELEARPGYAEERPTLREFIAERLAAGSENLYKETLRRVERQLLTQVLEQTGGNQLKAARILGMSRGSLASKLRALGISSRGGDKGPDAARATASPAEAEPDETAADEEPEDE
ncbi:MAG TPA: sigma-54 dependent transcriptional regulator [Gemmataceae bacterium]|nr:sigma-54 dependent transcriptional regulator [Gemmataceae bacterium]